MVRDLRAVAMIGLALAMGGPAAAQRRPEGGDLAQEILATREHIRAAAAAKDRAALDALYAEHFNHVRSETGRTDLKGERIDLLLSGESTIETAPEDELTVEVYGPQAAAAFGVSPIKEASGRMAAFRWLAVYVRDGDRWRLALSQAGRAAPAAR